MMQKMFNELAKSYEPSSLRKIKSILAMALRKAKKNDLIIKDPMIGVKLPKLPKPEIESMAISDIDKFLDVAKKHNIYQAVVTGLGTGMRIGELDNDIVFCSKKVTYISFRNFNRALETICQKANVPRISANITSHTFATVAVGNKAELKTLADILGHKDVSTTYNNYVHPAKEVAELVNSSIKSQQ